MLDAALVRALAFYAPLLLVAVTAARWRPDRRQAGAALLAGLWNVVALLAVNALAQRAGWWRFGANGGEMAGLPVDLWLGWALLWGALPALLPRTVPAVASVAALVWLDLAFMPLGAPVVVLGPHWLMGEVVAATTALVPGLLLARATVARTHLALRVAMQVALFAGLIGGVAVAAVFAATGRPWAGPDLHRPAVQAALEGVALLALPGVAAVRELFRRGGGTPFPFDPPDRLVTTGPYAYVANPMQLSMTLALLAWAALLGSWAVAALAVVGAAFSAGIAGWHEAVELDQRHGEEWRAYRRHVIAWRPRWRPWSPPMPPARLFVAPGCEPCQGVGRWVRMRRPTGLEVRSAAESPVPLTRLTYVAADGHRAGGVAAFARALEHLHLGWAVLAWLLLLPGVGWFAQLLVDAVGGGPAAEPIGAVGYTTAMVTD